LTLRIAWFATGRGQTSGQLLSAALAAISDGRLDAEIVVVFCNRAQGEDPNSDAFLAQVEAAGLPLVTLSSRDFRKTAGGEVARKGSPMPPWRREYDRAVMRLLEPYHFDVGVLAGYMLIFGEEAAARWDLLNLHPAAPGGPVGVWQDIVWHLIETHAETGGVMIHLATPELDEGPVVTFCSYSLRVGDIDALWADARDRGFEAARAEGEELPLFQEIRRRGVLREMPLLVETVRAFADGTIRIADKRILDSSGAPVAGLDLTDRIEQLIAGRA
jgi:folate-dependent phosphoribosylglycinamide formyltransferase PurN